MVSVSLTSCIELRLGYDYDYDYGYGYKGQWNPYILVLVGHRNTEEKNSILIDVMVSFLLFILDRSYSGVISNSRKKASIVCISYLVSPSGPPFSPPLYLRHPSPASPSLPVRPSYLPWVIYLFILHLPFIFLFILYETC